MNNNIIIDINTEPEDNIDYYINNPLLTIIKIILFIITICLIIKKIG
jgi:hypothetical protein